MAQAARISAATPRVAPKKNDRTRQSIAKALATKLNQHPHPNHRNHGAPHTPASPSRRPACTHTCSGSCSNSGNGSGTAEPLPPPRHGAAGHWGRCGGHDWGDKPRQSSGLARGVSQASRCAWWGVTATDSTGGSMQNAWWGIRSGCSGRVVSAGGRGGGLREWGRVGCGNRGADHVQGGVHGGRGGALQTVISTSSSNF